MMIRPETSDDISAIEQVTLAAFTGKSYSALTEHLIVNELRKSEALFISLVAEIDNKVIGHVALSVVTIDGESKGWYGLGPVSVLPEFQAQGIGSKLIKTGLSLIREKGAQGCRNSS